MKKANGATKQLVQVVVANTMVIFATIMKICRGIVFFLYPLLFKHSQCVKSLSTFNDDLSLFSVSISNK